MRPTYDVVVAGAGMSGRSAAAHLAVGGYAGRSVLLVDADPTRVDRAAWASWTATPRLLDAAADRSWDRVRVCAGDLDRVVDLAPYRYVRVHGACLRRVATDLARRAGFEERVGRVVAIEPGDADDPDALAVVVVDGEPVRARWVLDSVLAAPGPPTGTLLAFTGLDVTTEQDAFDPQVPTLFDFGTQQRGAARFVYVLPETPRRALVELTSFTPSVVERRAGDAGSLDLEDLQTYLADRLGRTGGHARAAEHGVLPLHRRPPTRRHGRVRALGVRGGLLKPSTGYAYDRVQRDSAALARSFAEHGHPFAAPAPHGRYAWLDDVLLRAVRHDPSLLEATFSRLFGGRAAAEVLAFLDEDTSLVREARLVADLPPAPFLRSALG